MRQNPTIEEIKEILAELRSILENALEILDPEITKQNSKYHQPVFKKNGEKLCQAPSTK
jgi:phosphotransacetylase